MCLFLSLSDNCKKTGLVFDDVVGIVEIINCKDVKVQVCLGRWGMQLKGTKTGTSGTTTQ